MIQLIIKRVPEKKPYLLIKVVPYGSPGYIWRIYDKRNYRQIIGRFSTRTEAQKERDRILGEHMAEVLSK